MPSFLELALHKRWQDGKVDGRIITSDVLSTSHKNVVNFGPLTLEFMMLICQPFRHQMDEISKTPSSRSHFLIDVRQNWHRADNLQK